MFTLIAQSTPVEGKVIRRTIEEVGQEPVAPQQIAESQAGSSVFFGVGAIILLVIACGAIAMYWKNK